MPQYGYYFILVAPLEEYLAHSVGEDAVQPVPPMRMVTELEASALIFLHEPVVLPSEQAEDLTKGGIQMTTSSSILPDKSLVIRASGRARTACGDRCKTEQSKQ